MSELQFHIPSSWQIKKKDSSLIITGSDVTYELDITDNLSTIFVSIDLSHTHQQSSRIMTQFFTNNFSMAESPYQNLHRKNL